ncbi:MAG: hypothetical protein ACKOE2_00485 [Actinomycetales bacterium]
MATEFLEVLPNSEARDLLPQVAARFRREGVGATPVVFGNHRRPEGVMLPFPLFEQLLPAIEEIQLAELIRTRLAASTVTGSFDALAVELGFSPSDFE